jgi:ERF superfamily
MHRSSESIGTTAAALARAQAELINPEKSLVATIRPASPREAERTFRYAPLSSGLDIVRKGLGKHEIATVQTTAIDKEAGLVRLTTVLAHSSGEWVSSEWPVCPISDTALPQRMGAALTYARRYALFTLVGIAGEDDLDAPDLGTGAGSATLRPTKSDGQVESVDHTPPPVPSAYTNGSRRKAAYAPSILEPSASAQLRVQLSAELQAVASAEEAVVWARRSLPAKNTLTVEDAQLIEAAFQSKIGAFPDRQLGWSRVRDPDSHPPPASSPTTVAASAARPDSKTDVAASVTEIAVPACSPITKPRRIRDKRHRDFVSAQACLICGRQPADAHHLRFAQPRAMGRKVSDEFSVPLCRIHHREIHQARNEKDWWKGFNINPIAVAEQLWAKTSGTSDA